MHDAMRRSLIQSDLIQACADGRLSRKEKDSALWLLNAIRLEDFSTVVGIPTDLKAKLLQISPLLSSEGDALDGTAEEPRNTQGLRAVPPAMTFGFTPKPD